MPPIAAVAAAGAAIGLIGAGVAAATGAGKSKYRASNFRETPGYKPNQFEYGGTPDGANEAVNNYRNAGKDNAGAQFGLIGEGFQDRTRGLEARAAQGRAAARMENRALGNDLISKKVADRARTGVIAEGASRAAGARGAAGIALAGQDAANATSTGLADIGSQEAVASASEQLQNEGATMAANTAMRQGDDASRAQSLGSAAQFGQLTQGYGQLENDVRGKELQGGMTEQQILANSHGTQQHIDSGTQANNAAQDMKYMEMAVGGATGGLQAGASMAGGGGNKPGSDPRMKEGVRPLGSTSTDDMGPEGGDLIDPKTFRKTGNVLPGKPGQRRGVVSGARFGGHDPGKDHTGVPSKGGRFEGSPEQVMQDLHAEQVTEATRRGPKDFHRDTPAEQAQVKKTYEDGLLKEANARIAALEARLAEGPSARRLASGTPESGYETELTQGSEEAFAKKYGEGKGEDYDLRGAHASGVTDKTRREFEITDDGQMVPVFRGHLPDTFKKPGHETFSDESQYAQYAPDQAGRWEGDRYVPPASDPAAKKEAFELGRASGAAETERARATDLGASGLSMGAKTLMSPGYVIPAAVQAWRAQDADKVAKEREGEVARLQRKGDKRKPEVSTAKKLSVSKVPEDAIVKQTSSGPPTTMPFDPNMFAQPGPGRNTLYDARYAGVQPNAPPSKGASSTASGIQNAAKIGQALVMPGTIPIRAGMDALLEPSTPPASDPRAKQLGGAHANEVSDLLDKTPAVDYKYKDEYFEPDAQNPGQRQAGFLTSDLKKTRLGSAVVEERPDGYEGYNPHRMMGLEWAGLQNVHERLRDLEARSAKRGR